MDAPTTRPADSGTSGDNGTPGDSGGGSGWFTPRKTVDARPADSGAEHPAEELRGAQDRIAAQRRSLASLRVVGAGAAPESSGAPVGGQAARATRRTPEPPEADRPPTAQPPASEPPKAFHAFAPRPSARPGAGAAAPEHAVSEPLPAYRSPGTPAYRPDGPDGSGTPAYRPDGPHPQESRYDAVEGSANHPAPEGSATRPAPDSDRPAPMGTESGSPDAILVRRTLAEAAPVADKVTAYFYALLFVRHPDLRSLFPAAMDTQRDRLLKALLTAAEHMDDADLLTDYLEHLGRGHRKYGTEAAHYPAVGEALIGALSRYATTTWDDEAEGAWIRTYTTISQIMIDAAAENQLHAPAWWQAEVVSHDLRTPDIAVITVRPDQPYPFLAGQYTSLETPWWPRIWRHYSFASAPRSDGLLSFHVKAVPAGWVSNALVHRARPGDVLRLGPPAGSMTVDHTTESGLLCVGGGTGIAPIKALVEDVAEHGESRPVEVFYGARTDHDLYDIDTMLRLQQAHPWLAVRAVIDGRTQLPDVVREYGPWNEYDAYLSGPPGMIRSGVHALRGVGVPFERIRHDSLEELVAAVD
ncbi:globin domain-containing protein [Streptomyces sp. SP18CS02]|uniref:globin domain-containing protein n=1 Tax=Streptomyces sp. SP18CS02 TaxID=3002531 RepID=UPI002E76732A|nr:globin domain-containing protein [Streptomyces sp. SP18CS02]MEE1754331.1 FAD-binding oxidoreductase [Streptomyces sp. SP18CS02]